MSQDSKLHRACLDGNLGLVRQYLAESTLQERNEKDADGRTPLHWAVSSDAHLEIVRALLEAGDVDVNAQDTGGWTPLMIASSAGAARVVKELLKQ